MYKSLLKQCIRETMQELLEEEIEEIEHSEQALQEMLSRANIVMDKITETDFD